MPVKEGRQHAKSMSKIRADHFHRYRYASTLVPKNGRVLDLGAGIGYGSKVIADAAWPLQLVRSVDVDQDALDWGKKYFRHSRVERVLADLAIDDWKTIAFYDEYSLAIMFEIIEHLSDPLPILMDVARHCKRIVGSVPNETVLPFDPKRHKYHTRHYTLAELDNLLRLAGFTDIEWLGQSTKKGPGAIPRPYNDCINPMFIVFNARGQI